LEALTTSELKRLNRTRSLKIPKVKGELIEVLKEYLSRKI